MVLILLAGLLAVVLFTLSGSDPPPVMTGGDRERVAGELRELQSDIESIRKDADRGVARDFTIHVTEDQLNLWLSEDESIRRTLREKDIEDAWVRLHDGDMEVTVLRAVGTLTVQVKASMVAEIAEANTVRVRITSMSFGRLGAPRSASERLAEQIGRMMTSKLQRPNVRLVSLKVRPEGIEVVGRTAGSRPPAPTTPS